MSIPPLVCSTPPPPEQCEDDKDHEDFEISYNLSQEDDEDSAEYNFGNYSAYNIYQSKTENLEQSTWSRSLHNTSESKTQAIEEPEKVIGNVNFFSDKGLNKENNIAMEETVIEDLNLVIDKTVENSHTDLGTKDYDIQIDPESESSDSDNTRIQDEGGTNNSIHEENGDKHIAPVIINVSVLNENERQHDNMNDITSKIVENSIQESDEVILSNDCDISETSENNHCTIGNQTSVQNDLLFENQDDDAVNKDNFSASKVLETEECLADDDFGDFEDFQINPTEYNQPLPESNENPWINNTDSNKTPEFGDFTANFDFEEQQQVEKKDTLSIEVIETQNIKPQEEGNDDFGDFDDYRSTENAETSLSKNEVTSAPDITVWNLHSTENDPHIVDSINTMLTTIFTNKIPEPENELLGKLESYLSETWGHLIDTDVRQPYIVNWNNSLGQKTLLKALCIDSRNILFGPKWNYNMPKYAANLSSAPLQPKKQITPSNSSNADSTEKAPSKDSGGWVDPFTPDGQEYTYAEALLLDLEHLMATLDQMAHKHSTLKVSELLSHACHTENESGSSEVAKRPTDLNILDSEKSTKVNKIYSSTLNVQPLRHINLPDTHIFTPTDSETPRSKTIHYDNGPALALPQDNDQDQSEKPQAQFSDSVESEYWEFQDFKGTNTAGSLPNIANETIQDDASNVTTTNNLPNAGMTYQTQILQPIKIEPIIPTLNWPDPGEVKDTFADFSDFITSTKWGNETENQTSNDDTKPVNVNLNIPIEKASETQNIDDEFETFQSAPISTLVKDFSLSSITNSQKSESATKNNPETSFVKVKINNNTTHNNVFIDNQSSFTSNSVPVLQDFTSFPQGNFVSQNSTDILQPSASTSSGPSRNQQKSGQILQPLTLESYSQINWPNPGIDLQDLSRFNPINSLNSLKSELNTGGSSKSGSPAHSSAITTNTQTADDEIWGDFVSSAPKPQEPSPKKAPTFVDDDEWTDFVSSPNIKPQNGLNTISFNVHTNLSMQKSSNQNKLGPRNNQIPLDIPTLNYITPKSNNRGMYSEKHFENL